jgi:hypothetical protein
MNQFLEVKQPRSRFRIIELKLVLHEVAQFLSNIIIKLVLLGIMHPLELYLSHNRARKVASHFKV